MKKKLIVAITLILIATHVIPSNNISFANEKENNCELMDFTVQTIKENDDKLEGKASANQKFEIEFIRQDVIEEIFSDNNGKLEYKFEEDYLKENDKIIIRNEHHKIEIIVAAEEVDSKTIDSKEYIECVITEKEDDNNSESENPNNIEEELFEKPEENATTEDKFEETEIEAQSLEEDTTEGSRGDINLELKEPEESAEKSEDEKNDSTKSKDSEPVKEDVDIESSKLLEAETNADDTRQQSHIENEESKDEDTGDNSTNQNSDEDRSLDEQEAESNKKVKTTIRKRSISNIEKDSEECGKFEGKTAYICTLEELKTALSQYDIETIEVMKDIPKPDSKTGSLEVNSTTSKKYLNVNDRKIDLGDGTILMAEHITDFYAKNASNLLTTSAGDDGFFKKEKTGFTLHLANINFNNLNASDGGKLGSNWEGSIIFNGINRIKVKNGNDALAFSNVTVSNGSDTLIESYGYGRNDEISPIKFNKGAESYSLSVGENARLHLHSNSSIIESKDTGDKLIKITAAEGSDILFNGYGREIIKDNLSSPTNKNLEININKVKNFEIINRRATIFEASSELFDRDFDNIFVNVTEVNISSGDTETYTSVFPKTTGSFVFRTLGLNLGWKTENIKLSNEVNKKSFETHITPKKNRLKFSNADIGNLSIQVETIYRTDKKITGSATLDSTVIMRDEKGGEIDKITVSNDGRFTFEKDLSDYEGTLLLFQVVKGVNKSQEFSMNINDVTPDVLNLSVPDSIVYKNTVIKNEETTIYRDLPHSNYEVTVNDERPNGDWDLYVKATPLSNGNHSINNAVHFIDGSSDYILSDSTDTLIAKKNPEAGNVQTLSWGAEEGILLRLNPIQAQADTAYSSTIIWTLTDGP